MTFQDFNCITCTFVLLKISQFIFYMNTPGKRRRQRAHAPKAFSPRFDTHHLRYYFKVSVSIFLEFQRISFLILNFGPKMVLPYCQHSFSTPVVKGLIKIVFRFKTRTLDKKRFIKGQAIFLTFSDNWKLSNSIKSENKDNVSIQSNFITNPAVEDIIFSFKDP